MPRRLEIEIVGDTRSLERAFSRTKGATKGLSASFSNLSRNTKIAFAAVTAGVSALGVASIRSSANFEQTMQKVVGLSGVAQSAIGGLTSEILRLAPSVGKGPQELAEGLQFITSSGIAAADAMEVLEVAAKAAAAGLGDTQTVADAVTSVMNAYGPAVVDAQKATDVLVATVREGKGEASDFAGVIGNVVSIASQLGVSFNDVGAALAAMTRLGTDAETAATQLQAVFSNLTKVTPQQEKAFKAVGLSAAALRQELAEKGLLETLKTIQEAFQGNIPLLSRAFGDVRALRGVLALVGNQADATAGIFNRLGEAAGSLENAFGAVSDTAAQQFARASAAAQVAKIQIGAALAPLAEIVARGLTAATTELNEFFEAIGEARTIRAKLRIVFDRVTGAAEAITQRIGDAVADIDWDAVWARARGVADGLQQQLEAIDFGFVGERIGQGIADAVRVAIPAAKDLAERISNALSAIDFEELGKRIGPGLAAAVVSAFVTLLDPAFWLRNWDLALAVAATVFRARILAFAGKLVEPLRRLGSDLVLRIGVGLLDAMPRLGAVLIAGLSRLPALVAKALSPLTAVVSRLFVRLGRIGRFVVTVLGIQAAINAVVGFARRAGEVFADLGRAIGSALDAAWEQIKRGAIRAALAIVEPFSHLPAFFGGWARDAKERLQGQLDGMAEDADRTAKSIQRSLNSIQDKTVTVTVLTVAGRGRGGPAEANAAAQASASAQAAQKAAAAKAGAVLDQAVSLVEQISQKAAAAAAKGAQARERAAAQAERAAAAAEKAAEKQRAAFDRIMESLGLKLDIARASRGFADDLKALADQERQIRAQIRIEGRTVELERGLFDIRQERARIRAQIAQQEKDARQAAQFRALGLTAEGDTPTPTVANLQKQLQQLTARLGTDIAPKMAAQLARIGKVLSGALGKVTEETRAKILELFEAIRGTFDDQTKGPLTSFTKTNARKLLAGLDLSGLSTAQIKELRARLSQVSSGGSVPAAGIGAFGFAVSGPIVEAPAPPIVNVYLDGHQLEPRITIEQGKRKARTSSSRRGRFAGQ